MGRLVHAFHNVVHLHVDSHTLIPFHGLSPTIKSLHLQLEHASPSEVLGFMFSFPLLEDLELRVYGYGDQVDEWVIPSASPRLTGSLRLSSAVWISPFTRRLLDLPNGPKFTEIILVVRRKNRFQVDDRFGIGVF